LTGIFTVFVIFWKFFLEAIPWKGLEHVSGRKDHVQKMWKEKSGTGK